MSLKSMAHVVCFLSDPIQYQILQIKNTRHFQRGVWQHKKINKPAESALTSHEDQSQC